MNQPQCANCPLKDENRPTAKVYGNPNAPIALVLPFPTKEEERDDPQGNAAMKYLMDMIQSLGIDICITHAVACRPAGVRNPTSAEMDRCRPRLEAILTGKQVIITMGISATHCVTGREVAINLVVGEPMTRMFGGCPSKIVPTYSAGFAKRFSGSSHGERGDALMNALQMAAGLLEVKV